jgi:hypothetical protein
LVVLLAWLGLVAVAIGYWRYVEHARPWYERVRVTDGGPGPLGASDSLV